jgi:amidase
MHGAPRSEPSKDARSGRSTVRGSSGTDPELGPGIVEGMAYASSVTDGEAAAARATMAARCRIRECLSPRTVLTLPTTPSVAPPRTSSAEALEVFRTKTMALTCIAGLSGLPQVTLPAGPVEDCPVGISLVGAAGSDELLLELAVALGRYCGS